jgi:hypothetical protein
VEAGRALELEEGRVTRAGAPDPVLIVRAGQVYRSKAKRGWRFVRVLSVRDKSAVPYATVIEVDAEGEERTGRARDGFLFSQSFATTLTCAAGRWSMPSLYTLERDP